MEIRKGDIIKFSIAGIEGSGYSGSGMVIDANVIEEHLMDSNKELDCITIIDLKNIPLRISGLRTFGKQYVTKIIKRREDIKNFWEYFYNSSN